MKSRVASSKIHVMKGRHTAGELNSRVEGRSRRRKQSESRVASLKAVRSDLKSRVALEDPNMLHQK